MSKNSKKPQANGRKKYVNDLNWIFNNLIAEQLWFGLWLLSIQVPLILKS